MDSLSDKLSIKNLLFTKALPNYEIPTWIDGKISHKIFSCTDCGDKFVFESSYKDHVNRRSVLITYMCRHCGETKVFYNRCRLLFHIRSHSFKTATINVQDLKVEPLPIGLYKQYASQITASTNTTNTNQLMIETTKKAQSFCFECKKLLPSIGFAHKVRATHYMQYTNEVYSCPVCLFTLPTICGLRAHMRFHLKFPPYYCPECGVHIADKNMKYPFNHDCEGFNMMRATSRLKCPVPGKCQILHPNEFNRHMKNRHIKKVYKCPVCVVASFNEPTMLKHLTTHNVNGTDSESLIFYQCELCPGRLVLQIHIDNHLLIHSNTSIYPCWSCGAVFKEVFALVDHQMKKHDQYPDAVKKMFISIILESENQTGMPKRLYRVVKRCDQCESDFTYKCKFEDIESLPNECPHKCTSKLRSSFSLDDTESQLTCSLCDIKMPYNWDDIKKHFAMAHKKHRCLDPKVVIHKIDIKNYMTRNQKKITKRIRKKKPQIKENATDASKTIVPISGNHCRICGQAYENKKMMETHLISHRDPCMAYQCLECGQSFVVKPSFSKHLVVEHGIYNAEEYISSKPCYNETALDKHQKSDTPIGPPKENQCRICMDQFENSEDLEKHFRVHGMAFLLKNTVKVNEKTTNKIVENIIVI